MRADCPTREPPWCDLAVRLRPLPEHHARPERRRHSVLARLPEGRAPGRAQQGRSCRNSRRARPDGDAKREAFRVFETLDVLDPVSIGAEQDTDFEGQPAGLPYLRCTDEVRELFLEWRTQLEARLRSGELPAALESHLAKYRKLVSALALLLHLANGGTGQVSAGAMLQALAWAEYLETHARRAYASGVSGEVAAANAILARIRKRDLPQEFSRRDVWRPGWTGLADREGVASALELLVDYAWLDTQRQETGGRTAIRYVVNPRGPT